MNESMRMPGLEQKAGALSGGQSDRDVLAHGRAVLEAEGRAVLAASEMLGLSFCKAVRMIHECTGCVVVTGIGKAGLVARKITATLASLGSPAHFLHPAEAMHGDLGVLRGDDLLLALSQSGESEEITRLLPHVTALRVPIVAITGNPSSSLGRAASIVVSTGTLREACSLGLAPSTSTAVMLGLGDALALTVSSLREFSHDDFAQRHPGGSLGRKLATVDEVMQPLEACRVAKPHETVREVFGRTLPARRTGAVMIIDQAGTLAGIFTDSDLARLFERRNDAAIDAPIEAVMTGQPRTVRSGLRLSEAVGVLERHRVSELPVVDHAGRPVGLLDIVDLVGLVPPEMLPESVLAREARRAA